MPLFASPPPPPQGYYPPPQGYGPPNPYGAPIQPFGGGYGRQINQGPFGSGLGSFMWFRIVIIGIAISLSLVGACISAIAN